MQILKFINYKKNLQKLCLLASEPNLSQSLDIDLSSTNVDLFLKKLLNLEIYTVVCER